ncbi:MAG TPA: ATP-binding protein [Nannocystaceae bacterium]|nr:ATP-binding protein [Nannocystaceae bacterium]
MQDDPRLGPFFDLSPAPCLLVGADATIAAANRAWHALGYDPASLAGAELARLLRPGDVEPVRQWLAAPASAEPRVTDLRSAGGTWVRHELRFSRIAEGTTALSAQPVHEAERGLAERAEMAAANWQALSSCLEDFVVTADTSGAVQTLNRDPPGIPPGDLIGKPGSFFTPIAPAERPALRARFEHVVKTGDVLTYETRVAYPDGSIGTFQSRLAPIRASRGIVGVVLVTRDITAQRQAEAARRAAEKSLREHMAQLERSNGELERFASVASHDLQEPLRKILAFAERLDKKFAEEMPATGRDYISRMQDAARRMQSLINDLLVFSRLSTKPQTATEVSLDKLVKSVVSDLEVRIEESGGKVEVGPLPVIHGDPTRLRQLFQNLIANAIKFRRPEEPPIVTIAATVQEDGGREIAHITVADNGIGIEPQYRERVFGIFERLHGRGKYEGTGIGLAICRKICEQQGGTISIDSAGEFGSVFNIVIPVRGAEEEAIA